ncbi:MAG: peptidylprolyl isomerase [Chloroflexi bacterium]|nr:peptidylprolyl isomerase [Chloroflexota bacterium]
MLRRSFVFQAIHAGALTGSGALAALAAACAIPGLPGQSKSSAAQNGKGSGKRAVVELEKGGSFTIQLFPDAAPKTVQNFEQKASQGYYNGLTFHRVEDWVVQGGDPRGNGTGGGTMPSELNDKPFVVGAVGVARGQDIRINNDSQFFICTKPAEWLNKTYTNFGQVSDGMDVVNGIKIGDKIRKITVLG